jgi:hypothetical protein
MQTWWNARISKSISHESSACDALIEKTALHLKHLAELIDSINMILINAEPNTKKLKLTILWKNLGKTKEIFAITEKWWKKRFKRLLP